MKKTLLIIMALAGTFLSPVIINEQERLSITPRVGFNLSSIGGEGSLDAYSTRLGFTGGVDAEFLATPMLGISLGVAYSSQGCNTNEMWNYRLAY